MGNDKKRVLLLVPKMEGPGRDGRWNASWTQDMQSRVQGNHWKIVTPSLLVVASIAEQHGFAVDVVDEEFRYPEKDKHYDLVCMYLVTPNALRGYALAAQYRAKGSYVALGGVHVRFCPDEAEKNCGTLFIGETERTFPAFLSDFIKGTPRKRYIQADGVVSPEESPLPLLSGLSPAEQRLIPLQTARGCVNACRFCAVGGLYGSGFRAKSSSRIAEELCRIDSLEHAKRLYITNDNLFNDQDHFQMVTELVRRSGKPWYANMDISFGADSQSIRHAFRCGLRQVLIGFESLEKKSLGQLDVRNLKYRYRDRYAECIERIQSQGIGVVGSFILGFDDDTEKSFGSLAEFIYDTKLYGASVTMLTPYPGTKLFDEMARAGRIATYDWNHYTIFQPIIKGKHLPLDRLLAKYNELLLLINSSEFQRNKVRCFSDAYRKVSRD